MRPAAKIVAVGGVALLCGLTAALWPTNAASHQSADQAELSYLQQANAASSGCTMALPADIHLPDLSAWHLVCADSRRIVSEGKPGFQFLYTTDFRELGPVTLFVTRTTGSDNTPAFEKRDNIYVLHWRRRSHGYYIVSSNADKGWLWSLKSDIAYQLRTM